MLTLALTLFAASRARLRDEGGFSTAELLANAAFAIVALFAIWQALQALGINVINQIGTQLSGGL